MDNLLLARVVNWLFRALSFLIIARVIADWIAIGMRRPNLAYHPIVRLLYNLTEPLLAPLRRALNRYQGRSGLDFSPLVLLILVQVLQRIVVNMITR